MLNIFASIAPVFSLIILGHVLRRLLISDMNFWHTGDKLVYWVLMPSLLFYHTSTINLDGAILGKYALVVLSGFLLVVILPLLIGKIAGFSPPVITSLLQGSCRHNSFIVLAIVSKLYGNDGVALATLGIAVLIPATNIVVVSSMVALLRGDGSSLLASLPKIFYGLATNPIFLAIVFGLLFSIFYDNQVFVLHDTVRLLGGGALPLILLVIGANIKIKDLKVDVAPVAISTVLKLIVFPLMVYVMAVYIGLSQLETMVIVMFGAVPTAVSSYTLAKQMGGAVELMSTIITIQTLLSFITIPILLSVLG
jgi:malonate transporter and related proteins